MRRPSTAAAAPVLADTADEAEFDLSEPESETPIALADEAAPTRATSEDEAQFEMLRLFYLRGDHAGFEDTARFVREHNPDPDLWRRVAEMGRMLAPDNPLYADASARRMEFDFSDLQPPQPAETMVEQESGLHDTMFELEPEPDVAAPPAQRADSEPEPFEFDQRPPPPPPMDDATVAMPTLAPELEQPPLEWEPSVADVEPEPQPEPEPAPAPVAADSASHAGGPQDPVDTKLELAQAYLEMGDAEGAQHMLDEVMNEGDSRQKAEALRLREQAGPAQRRA
jgi:pilus assembly protein FimV